MNWLAGIALALSFAALVTAVLDLRGGRKGTGRWLMVGAAGITWISFLFLLSRFIVTDVAYEYVWTYTSTDVPLRYRIAGTWTGREGSLLLWSAYLVTAAAVVAWRRKADAWTQVWLSVFVTAFLAAVWAQDTFRATPSLLLEGRPLGNGLNPTLKSPFILIHPPLMFLAYALTTVPASAALGHLVSGHGRWAQEARSWARIDWGLYTFAMGLGGAWAYLTLGFGGYWAWDPVEVANLLPWLALTAYMHAQAMRIRYGSYAAMGPFLALLPFLLTLFSTMSTRSGLWISVHAFTDPTNTFQADAFARALAILAVQDEVMLRFYTGLFMVVLLGGLALWCRRLATDHGVLPRASRVIAAVLAALAGWAAVAPRSLLSGSFEVASLLGRTGYGLLALLLLAGVLGAAPLFFAPGEANRVRLLRLEQKTLVGIAATLLALSTLVLFLFHLGAVNGWNPAFYEARLPLLATPALLVLLAHLLRGPLSARHALQAVSGIMVLAVAAGLVLRPWEGAYMSVLSAALLGAAIWRAVHTGRAARTHGRRTRAGVLLLLAGILDLWFWINPPSVLGGWVPRFPVQIILGAAALFVIVQAHRILAGANPRWPVFLVAILLGGYFIAAALAGLAWYRFRGADVRGHRSNRLHQAAIYGIHIALATAMLGYTVSTYYADEVEATLGVGESVAIGGHVLAFEAIRVTPEPGTPWVDEARPRFSFVGEDASLEGILYWEPQTGSHFPLPATKRFWNGDVYLNVDGLCTAPDCQETVLAYEPGPRMSLAEEVHGVKFRVRELPGIGLVWASLAMWPVYMGMLMLTQDSAGERHRRGKQEPSAAPDAGPREGD